jgi:plasmid segregation protein ParM
MNIGYDGGFYAIKAASRGETTTFPSFAVRPVESHFSLDNHTAVVIQSDRTGELLVGKEAVKKGRAGARQEAADWIRSREYLAMFYRALSDLSSGRGVRVNLVTGLPLADYGRDKDVLRSVLEGSHTFTRQGRHSQTFTVESVRVVPQAWGAVLYLLLDDRGRVVEPELVNERVAVLDIGGRTVNYLSVDGLSDIPAESEGTHRGAWNVVRVVRDYLNGEHPVLNRLQDHDIMGAILSGEIYDANERVDLVPVTADILVDIGQEIVDTAEQYWGARAATHRRVLVIGGGSYLWKDDITGAFPQAIVLPQPELVNAKGFYRFACYVKRELANSQSSTVDE